MIAIVQRWKVVFPAKGGPEERTAYVYLPTSYPCEPERRYPVLYMFDGHNLFFDSDATYGKSWGLGEYLDYTDTPLIVAAVECNHSPDHGRLKEYSPYPFNEAPYGEIEGLGETTMEWFINVFKPEIDRSWRTLPDREHTFISGSSMGGLMGLYAVLAHNDVYSRAACLSPSLWTDFDALKELVRTATLQADTVIYMDSGAGELPFDSRYRKQFNKMTRLLLKKGVALTSRIVPFGEHCEACWGKQLPFAIHTLMYQLP